MRAGWRLRFALTALAFACAAAPAGAQNRVVPVTIAPPASGEVVGPTQLQDFSIDGTVTRRAEPREQQPQPPAQPVARTSPPTAPPAAAADRRQQAERQVRPEPRQPTSQPTAEAGSRAPAPTVAAPDFSAFGAPPPADSAPAGFVASDELPPAAPTTDFGEDSSSLPQLPWLLALLAVAGAGVWYFLRQRPRLAAAGGVSELVEPQPEPEPLRRAPAAAPRASSPPQGVVSTRLRPWLDIGFAPERCEFGDDGATIEFLVTVTNSGSAPARDVLVEAVMVNAGDEQGKEIGGFFARPAGQGDRIPAIGPLKSLPLRHAVKLSREQLRVYQAGDRTVFVPVIAFNALYRHGGGEAQTSAAWLVGRATSGDKMGPFRADQGARSFAGLAARPLDTGVRN